jgi:hypothetical protein
MPTINDLKELEVPGTPLFLFDCTLKSGDVQRWSTHPVTVNGQAYLARVLKHNLFELNSSPEAATDGVSKVSITLANADSFFSAIERNIGWKGAQVTVTFLFFDLMNAIAASDSRIVFRGIANPPDESTESTLRLSFTNRLNLQRVFLPEIRIQKRCPWTFPTTTAQRQEAVSGGTEGVFSVFYRCGYSPDQASGAGNLNAGAPYATCDYSRAQCVQRGMFDKDGTNNVTRRFGGIEFVPASIFVRTYGEKGSHVSIPPQNVAFYNDFVPLIYGTGWYQPPIVFARNDGNLTRLEVLLGAGEVSAVLKIVVNNTEIPVGVAGSNMTATGWYTVVSSGTRNGGFNLDFTESSGNPLGDPYGSMAFMSVVVPNRISDGSSLPSIKVLIQGLKLARFDSSGNHTDDVFTNNSAWVLLDVLRRSGWDLSELDLASFSSAAQRCDALVHTTDLNGNDTLIPRYQCNLLLTKRRSAGDIIRGIRNASALYLTLSPAGLLQLNAEDTLALQQPSKPAGSNGTTALNGGWPAYEFGDNAFSGVLRRGNGEVSLRLSTRSLADSPNRYTVEFQDEFKEYQQDSLSLVDVDDSLLCGQDITVSLAALGLPNFDQATRATALQLYKSVRGNTYVEFETSVKGVGLRPGDLITLTYSKEGFNRQAFRITKIAPGLNFLTAVITGQIHDDAWYTAVNSGAAGLGRQAGFEVGLPRPLVGSVLDTDGVAQFGVTQSSTTSSDGSISTGLSAAFSIPAQPLASGVGIPLVGLNSQINTTGGTLHGGQTFYYALSAIDANGSESGLSFTVMATIPATTNTNQVTLTSLSFSSSATGFHVYRGTNPVQLLRIAENVPVAAQFTDSGAVSLLKGPPDYNYDHANFYWRLELQPAEPVDIYSATTIGNSTLNMLSSEYNGATARITKGTGAGQERTVATNSATTVTITSKWSVEPDATSFFLIADSSWQFGASSNASPVSFAAMGTSDLVFTLTTPTSAQAGDLVQIGSEVLVVQQAVSGGTSFQVARGSHGSPAATHAALTAVYFLEKKAFIMPFARDFFGSPASGSYAYPVTIPDVRIGAAELFVTNSRGNSPVAMQAFTATTDLGLRTLSGGQLSIQVEGPLAIQTNAAPPLSMDASHSVRDVYAVVRDAPTGGPIVLQVTQSGQPYCQLTIPAGAIISNVVNGFACGPLQSQAQIGLDITSVVQTANSTPGRDLTVTIRL